MTILKISFFKTQQVRVFNYSPRFWNPDKERLEERRLKAERAAGIRSGTNNEPYRPQIKGEMMRQLEFGKRKPMKTIGGRMLSLLMLLLLLVGAFYASDYFSLLFTSTPPKSDVKTEQPVEQESNEDTHFIIPLD